MIYILIYIICTIAAAAYANVKDFIFKDLFGHDDPIAWVFYIVFWPIVLIYQFFKWIFKIIYRRK